ncbi:2OG-Fe(II) oxygenase [Mucilaginibacter sp. BJC16-A38]|uniref:2OG-Fe(II) oxygenase n=1 Tax=Mucilaginibacter phenanthrenivorans TaxID=1234842 RepID=UPI0021571CA9|nr:2OG-Fe(II) oxygenase [Mucilaginibacter phenanthrenivorans]MCR8560099.1 2OG-Fe(II) oxygenase [Mucilaginibacter phenanthrenivorans]
MELIFNELIDSYLSDKVGVTKDFLSVALAADLTANLHRLYDGDKLLSAGTGNKPLVNHNKQLRGDKIHWLDRLHKDVHEDAFFDLMDLFVAYLNQTCYAGITGYEFHYTLYEKGSFYGRHLDRFKNNGDRAYSMVMYLNKGWIKKDGGELRIYHLDKQQDIEPLNGNSIFFKSDELEHEVLLTNKSRMSITGWLKTN